MSLLAELRERIRALIFWNREEDAIDEEVRFHLDMETEKHVSTGLPPALARRQALRRFGGVQWHKDAVRQQRGIGVFEHLGKDVRHGPPHAPQAARVRRDCRADAGALAVPSRSVTSGYFDLLRIPIVEGRDFRVEEDESVAIVNETFAQRFFADGRALGRQIWSRGRQNPAQRIIGIAADTRTNDLTEPANPEIYLLFWQAGAVLQAPRRANRVGTCRHDGGHSQHAARR